MKATLCIPRPAMGINANGAPQPLDEVEAPLQVIRSRAVYRLRLRYVTHHSASHYGIGVLLDAGGEVLDGWMMRYLHDRVGAYIQTDDPDVCRAALGLPPEPWTKNAIRGH
jgi:hypothetical protein